MRILLRFLLIFIFCFSSKVEAEEDTKEIINQNQLPFEKRKVNLDYCLQLGLDKSLNILKQKYNVEIIDLERRIKQAYFDPFFWISLNRSDTLTPAYSTLEGTFTNIQKNTLLNAAMSQNLITGGSYSLTFNNLKNYSNSVYQFINPYYKTELIFMLTQPLLKNFGRKNAKFEIILTEYIKQISNLELKKEVSFLTMAIKKAYWNFIYYFYKFKIEAESFQLAQELLKMEEEKFRLGEISQLEILKSEKIVAECKKRLADAEVEFYEAEIKLKKIMNILPDDELWMIRFEPEEEAKVIKKNLIFSEVYQSSLKNNLEYLKKKKEIEKEKLFVERFKNQILPELNLVLGGGLNGLSRNYKETLNSLSSKNYYLWQIGIECKFPWGNREAKERYNQSKLRSEKKKVELEEMKLEIFTALKRAFNKVQGLQKKVNISQRIREIAEKRLSAEKEKLKRGVSSTYEVLRILKELTKIRIEELKDIIDYNIAIIELETLKVCFYKDKK